MHQSARDPDPTAEQHLDQEWRLFQRLDAGSSGCLLRTWEASDPVIVVGRNTPIAGHVLQDACRRDGIGVLRRVTGGGAVVVGPGCLNYAIGLSLVSRPELADVAASFVTILNWLVQAIGVDGLTIEGGSDLVWDGRKVSGNAQRRGRNALLHHGTLLYNFDASLASRYLMEPLRQPAYRSRRRHADFIGNLPLTGDELQRRLGVGLRPFLTHA
jgi:lipoate-protein ligase A